MSKMHVKIGQDGQVKYYGDLSINKKRVRRFLGYDLKVAKLALSKLEYELRFGVPQAPSQYITIQKGLLSFRAHLERRGLGDRQLRTLTCKLNAFNSFCDIYNLQYICDLKPHHLQSFIDNRSSSGLSPSTLNKDIGTLKRVFNHWNLLGYCDHNPALILKRFAPKPAPRRRFSDQEIKKIYAYRGQFREVYITLLETGIRIMDLKLLTPSHIEGRMLHICQLKTGERLCVPLPKKVLRIINERLQKKVLFEEIARERGRRACLSALKDLLTPSSGITMHAFRHTYAHRMLNKGVPKEVLQTLLGHKSIKTTERYANFVEAQVLGKWVR